MAVASAAVTAMGMATTTPVGGTYVEENDPNIVYSPLNAWTRETGGASGASYHGGGIARTFTTGASASYTFTGSVITILGTKGFDHGSYVVDVDGQPEALINGTCCAPGANIPQFQLFTKSNLPAGVQHTIIITNARKGNAGSVLELDSFIVTPFPSSSSGSGPAPEQDPTTNRNAIIGGTVVGSVVFLTLIAALIYLFLRKRQQRRAQVDKMAEIPIPQRTRRSSFFPAWMKSTPSLRLSTHNQSERQSKMIQSPHVVDIVAPKGPISRPQFATSKTTGSAFVEHLTSSSTSLPHRSAISQPVRSIRSSSPPPNETGLHAFPANDLRSFDSHDSLRSPVSFANHVERDITAVHGFADPAPTPPPPGQHSQCGVDPFKSGSESTHEGVVLDFEQQGGLTLGAEGDHSYGAGESLSHAPTAMRTLQRTFTGYASTIGVDPDMDDERMPPPPLPPKTPRSAKPTPPPTYSFDARTYKRKA